MEQPASSHKKVIALSLSSLWVFFVVAGASIAYAALTFSGPRALNWVKEYVTRRKDQGEALFVVGRQGRPMRLCAALTRFRRFRRLIRFPKPVTAHMLRHTVATTLLFNAAPLATSRTSWATTG
jgi:site-specific recombinase XerC